MGPVTLKNNEEVVVFLQRRIQRRDRSTQFLNSWIRHCFVYLPVFKRRFNLSERVKESNSHDHFHRPKSHVYTDYKRRNGAYCE